ncbi:hypothetical protein KQI41_10915 [Tissierella pigra]|uniref:Uncharacterized protein n=1 Tax=Tissierella pigra TaxID=2607614 RepID=A0A6N7Y0G0_9FIRM|nr:hypothetical protein [Tissierella pigra]MBU5426922.1 hypothetical protein [Tissierella pigra]MSU03233.1 hypothetical protein [Tissierella pigra]
MRINKTYILTISLVFTFIAAGFFLPEWMTAHTDQSIIGKVKFESIEPQKIISDKEITIVEKISLLRDYPQNVNRIALEMGTKFDLTSASSKFLEEISVLTKLGLLPEIELSDKTTVKIDVSLYVQKDEPTISGVFWNLALQEGEFLGNFYMDDYTGKIIQFVVTTLDMPLIIENRGIETWANYLGLEARKIESQPETYSFWEDKTTKISESGYNAYNFELKFEDHVLPYTFYNFENGYGFGYIKKFISSYNTSVKIRP